MQMWQDLSPEKEQEFRQHSRETFDPSQDVVDPLWHPVCRDECNQMITEYMNEQVNLLPSLDEIMQAKGD